MVRCRAAAPAYDIDPALPGEAADLGGHVLRREGVSAVLVRQSRVGVARDPRSGQGRQRPEVAGHEIGARCAVEPHREQRRVHHGGVEGLHVLAGQHRAHGLDGSGDHDGQVDAGLIHGPPDTEKSGLHVERILRRFEEQHVGAAGHETRRLNAIALRKFLEGGAPGHAQGPGGRPHGTCDEPRAGRGGEPVAGFPRDFGGAPVDLQSLAPQAVLLKNERRSAEGVRLHEIRSGFQVALVDPTNNVGARHHQVVEAAFLVGTAEVLRGEISRLEHGSRGPVEQQDPLVQHGQQLFGTSVHEGPFPGHRPDRRHPGVVSSVQEPEIIIHL